MKKNSKLILIIILCLQCIFFFAACSSNNDDEKKETIFLATPTGVSVNRQAYAIIWDTVENAKGYTVKINGTEYETRHAFFPLDNIIVDEAYFIQVRASGYQSGKKTYIESDYCIEIICSKSEAMPLNFFDIYRNDRNETKEMTISYLEDIINNTNSSAETLEAACNERLRLILSWEKELTIEALIKAHGFEDCIANFSNEKINIIVKKIDLSEDECVTILDIIIAELNIPANNVRIIPIA